MLRWLRDYRREWLQPDLLAGLITAAVVIPKVDSVEYVDQVSALLDEAGAPASVMIWPMIETPTAVVNVRSTAAHPRGAVLVRGSNDLAKELRLPLVPGRAGLVPHLAASILAARESGKVILDWTEA